jgi:hypothetical protein
MKTFIEYLGFLIYTSFLIGAASAVGIFILSWSTNMLCGG